MKVLKYDVVLFSKHVLIKKSSFCISLFQIDQNILIFSYYNNPP